MYSYLVVNLKSRDKYTAYAMEREECYRVLLTERRSESTTCTVKMLHQHLYSPLNFHTKNLLIFSTSNPRVIQTKLSSLWTTIQIGLLELANPWRSLHWKNKHGYYAGTHPIYVRNGVLGMQVIDWKSRGIFNASSAADLSYMHGSCSCTQELLTHTL